MASSYENERLLMFRKSVILVGVVCLLVGQNASAYTLNLLGRGSNLPQRLIINAGGINVDLRAGIFFNSTATSFGIDSFTTSSFIDDPNLIDGNEILFIAFDQDVLLDAITISQFDEQDTGTLILKSVTADIPLHNGINALGGIRLPSGPTHATDYRVQSNIGPIAGGTRGFSLDSIDFRPVPEPASCLLMFLAISASTLRVRRANRRR
jgi:hypothetical protein